MKTTINSSQFHDAFHSYNRANNFTYDGREALFDYLTSLEDETGEELELDVIALCCEYTEYSSAADCVVECGYSECDLTDEDMDDDEKEDIALDFLRDNTQVIEFDGGVIIAGF